MEYQQDLTAAVAQARACADSEVIGLAAQRRDHGDGEYTWLVAFDSDPAAFLTVISDEDVSGKSDSEIAAMIDACWDADWDDVQVERPAGDFSHGSSDWSNRA
jgi:hypothetical protein